jgi:bacterioferritin (cytochrome b1)
MIHYILTVGQLYNFFIIQANYNTNHDGRGDIKMYKDRQTSIEELNTYLKGEYMAIDSYEKYIKKIHDTQTKAEMQNILEDHKQHAEMISDRIEHLGGKPAKSLGLDGKVGQFMNSIKNIAKRSDEEICREACYWEEKGSKMAMEVVKGDLDHLSNSMISEIYSTDMNHLDKLRSHFK